MIQDAIKVSCHSLVGARLNVKRRIGITVTKAVRVEDAAACGSEVVNLVSPADPARWKSMMSNIVGWGPWVGT